MKLSRHGVLATFSVRSLVTAQAEDSWGWGGSEEEGDESGSCMV